ncbi:MAG: aldehyde-activating protein [Rhodobacteraceae bacterium]|nr:aldehyde-activating protein [Paracoccaceae bacterium]
MNKHTGGCLCGSGRFELNKEPDFAYGCHCRFCQKATGTAFRSGLRCQKSSVKFNDGEVKTYIYTSPEHGRSLNVKFCPTCATTVTVTIDRFPDIQVIMLGTLDDPSKIEIKTHMFTDERMHWLAFNDGDAIYPKHRINLDGTPATQSNIINKG